MSVKEIETEVAKLPPKDVRAFAQWFEEFLADQWDQQIESDVAAGKLDTIAKKVDKDFEAGLCTPL
jgi:hypothetical protein